MPVGHRNAGDFKKRPGAKNDEEGETVGAHEIYHKNTIRLIVAIGGGYEDWRARDDGVGRVGPRHEGPVNHVHAADGVERVAGPRPVYAVAVEVAVGASDVAGVDRGGRNQVAVELRSA